MAQNDEARADGDSAATDTSAQRVAAVYAKAFVAAAVSAGKLEESIGQLDSLCADLLDRFPRFESLLASGFLGAEEKIAILDRTLASQASPLLLNFLKVVAEHERLDCLREIRQAVQLAYDELRGRMRVTVTTATPLDGAAADRLKQSLHSLIGGEPVITNTIEPGLIGGIVLRVGDTVYDGSVATRLQNVCQQMIDRSVHEIQSRRDSFRSPA